MEQAGSVHPEPFCVVLITDGLFPLSIGGMQKHSVRLAAYMADAGARVLLFHPHESADTGQLFTPAQNRNINSFYVPWPAMPSLPGHYILRNYLYSKAVHERLQKEHLKPQVIYAQGLSGWYSITHGLTKTPVVLNLHGMEMFQVLRGVRNQLNGWLLRLPAGKLMKRAAAVVSLGGKLSEIIRKEAPGQTILELPVGIDVSWLEAPWASKTDGVREVLFVGRYEWRKGIDLLNQVMPAVLAALKDRVKFSFIGDIPDTHRMNHPDIHYYGALRDEQKIRSIYRNADLLVCPSYSEGMPTVILEAMACGLPVVATNVGAVSLLVSDSTGKLIEPGREDQLLRALTALLEAPADVLESMKVAAATKAKSFSWEKVARSTLDSLKHLASAYTASRVP
jgi:glycosyltransferase involved in cell wall biosynthesis